MDFDLSEEQVMLRLNARKFLSKEILPLTNEYEQKYHSLPKEIVKDLLNRLMPFGYVNGLVPEEEGGEGLEFSSYGLLLEELARVSASLAVLEMGQSVVSRYSMYKLGSPELKARYMPRLLSGELIGAHALTEPDIGSASRDITTTAVLEGDEYVINGTKAWSTGGDIADILYVTAVRKNMDGNKDFCTFVVDREFSECPGRAYTKLGTRGASSAEIVFDNCRVPKDNILGQPAPSLDATLETIGLGRLCNATIAVGVADAALEKSVEYAKNRKQFGRLIGKFQLIQEMIAEMYTEIECGRLLSYKGWDLLDKGKGSLLAFSAAKLFCTEMAIRVTSKAIEIHGAYGLSDEYPVERYFRDARCLTFPDATTEIQKLIIGREILEIPAFV
ncbi:MAG: acyl-CoA dehydrogenase family protein [Deltaproteobacteria bacterium]|nr:acyl-CoA dehydrogenase family protein [Deltaproteobacteria bacterium]